MIKGDNRPATNETANTTSHVILIDNQSTMHSSDLEVTVFNNQLDCPINHGQLKLLDKGPKFNLETQLTKELEV